MKRYQRRILSNSEETTRRDQSALIRPLSVWWTRALIATILCSGFVLTALAWQLFSDQSGGKAAVVTLTALIAITIAASVCVEWSAQRLHGRHLKQQGWPRVIGLSFINFVGVKQLRKIPPYEQLAVIPWSGDFAPVFKHLGSCVPIRTRIGGSTPFRIMISALALQWLLELERRILTQKENDVSVIHE